MLSIYFLLNCQNIVIAKDFNISVKHAFHLKSKNDPLGWESMENVHMSKSGNCIKLICLCVHLQSVRDGQGVWQ